MCSWKITFHWFYTQQSPSWALFFEIFPQAHNQGEENFCPLGCQVQHSEYQIKAQPFLSVCLFCAISISMANYNIYGTSATQRSQCPVTGISQCERKHQCPLHVQWSWSKSSLLPPRRQALCMILKPFRSLCTNTG